ncbi:MAG: GntR family transcriptional regulator [Bacillota bacterium]
MKSIEIEYSIPLKKRVLRDEVKNYLLEVILAGKFEPGDRIIETQIAKDLGVSQAPVREAIRDLEQMGILETQPYKGTYVRTFSVQDLKNVYDVRAELEGLAIRTAVKEMSEEEVAALEEITEQMVNSAGDLKKQIPLDIAFHEIIIKASRNNILEKVWYSVSIPYWTYLGTYYYKYDMAQLVKRHLPILEAIRNRDAKKAEQLMRLHFLELKDMLEEK